MQTLMRMTSDDPECITRHLNVFFAQGGDGYVRSGGPGNRDMELTAWIREAAGNIRAEIYAEDNECLCDELYDNLMYGIEEPEGVVAYLYLAALQAIEMRGRLKKIEDILGDTYDLDRLRELVQADREGRCVVLPMVERECVAKFRDDLKDVFSEWSYEDASVGLLGMNESEKQLAEAIITAMEMEENENG